MSSGDEKTVLRCGVPPSPLEAPRTESPVGSQLYQCRSKIMAGGPRLREQRRGPGGEEGEMKRYPEAKRRGSVRNWMESGKVGGWDDPAPSSELGVRGGGGEVKVGKMSCSGCPEPLSS